jgi:glycosyltransferase involved in cell wall biosynthesis
MSFGVLWIVGEGPEGSHLRSISSDMERVTFFGATEDVLKFYQTADVFVFPSMKEGFPNVLLEAMSCGLPCIASDIGGVTELISDDREGFIVPKGSSEKLSAALLRAAESKEDRMRWGKHALNRASDYEISAISKRYLALYSELSESR